MRGRLGGAKRFTIPVQSSVGALGEVFSGVAHGVVSFDAINLP